MIIWLSAATFESKDTVTGIDIVKAKNCKTQGSN
jgi:hypothetical protein